MSKKNWEKKKQQKQLLKEKNRKNKATPTKTSSALVPQEKISTSGQISLLQVENKAATIKIDISKLTVPPKKYTADSFVFKKYLGYSYLYFGLKDPSQREKELLNIVIIRLPNPIIKTLMIDGHEPFYRELFKSNPLSEEHNEQFQILLESQFPNGKDQYAIFPSNFIYAAQGMGDAELMFYKISPSFMHRFITGNPSITDLDKKEVDPVIMINLPINLLCYVYKQITEIKNEF